MRHHTESFRSLAETDDAVLAAMMAEPRECIRCGDTGMCGTEPCVCAHGVARRDA